MEEALLTITTPTYNRAHTLPVCYKSLCDQTDGRFLWMIVDDGSTDNTEELVNGWINENKIKIQYIKKENGGKASALNIGIDHLKTLYAVCLDSDDFFYPQAVEIALPLLDSVANDDEYCGILALRTKSDGTVRGGKEIPRDMKRVTAKDIFQKLSLRTELICFYKVSVLKQYRFPRFQNEKFISPAWMQYEITRTHYFLTSWDKICQCEYIADGLTRNKRKVIAKNPKGYTCVIALAFEVADSIIPIVKNGIMYDCGCLIGKDKDWLKNAPKKAWAIILFPAGYFVYLKRFKKLLNKSAQKN